jgi:glutathione synthase/RimK-type ligase-like ATP-grasp enzyme
MNKTLIVTDEWDFLADVPEVRAINFEQYLADYPKHNEHKIRVINLCDTRMYLSQGYYCSLLAEARKHAVLPSVKTINELREFNNGTRVTLAPLKKYGLQKVDASHLTKPHLVFFGRSRDPELNTVSKRIFQQYPAPILRMTFSKEIDLVTVAVERLAINQLNEAEKISFRDELVRYMESTWLRSPSSQKLRWEMAILINPDEPHPPSDKDAIKRFIKAAAKQGIHAQTITASQAEQVGQFDALFIRETTAIDHHTYRIATRAEREGVVVMDDPTSILRCCNKVYLHDAFTYNGVPAPRTRIVASADDDQILEIEELYGYPMVLKMPEGSFSLGVYKVKDREELIKQLTALLKDSALVLVQEYLYTEYDWRIGVLNGRAIFACKYLMVRGHWQIYDHKAGRNTSGGFETLPTFEVPKAVLGAALKAANMIGNGLYGVDIKQQGRQVFVIEVNDNPSIDYKVEDAVIGNELYMQIMAEFSRRLEQRGR